MAQPHTILPTFNVDDEFSEGDDQDVSFDLSAPSFREEIAHNLQAFDDNWAQSIDVGSNIFMTHDESVSTLDIDARSPESLPTSPSHSPNRGDEPGPSLPLAAISLSWDLHTHDWRAQDESAKIQVEDMEPYGAQIPSFEEESREKPAYPAVIIDVSKKPSERVTLSADTLLSPERSKSTPAVSLSPTDERPPPLLTSHRELPLLTIRPRAGSVVSSQSSPSLAMASSPYPISPNEYRHKPAKSVGPSMFETVVSKTRPTFLPPKNKKEDQKHMADWETMMKQSRLAAEKKRKSLQDRRLAREKKIDESLHLWERELLPDWKAVQRDPTLRKLWWRGIPTKLRASMWEKAVGNPLALSRDSYRTCLARANRAIANKTFPASVLEPMEADISTTLPSLRMFNSERGPLHQDLKDILRAWVVSRSDEGLGYTPGVARVAAMLLIAMPPQQGFIVMRNLLERHCLRSFYGGLSAKEDIEAYYRIFDTLLADGMPKIYFNFKQHQISPALYLPNWLIPVFLDHLPFEACARIWDVIMLEGDAFLFRAALGILGILEPRLFFPDKRELLELLNGENKAAVEVAKREGQALDGGKYEIYGVDEETLWERIDGMDEWWKESTWKRLIQRELPDI